MDMWLGCPCPPGASSTGCQLAGTVPDTTGASATAASGITRHRGRPMSYKHEIIDRIICAVDEGMSDDEFCNLLEECSVAAVKNKLRNESK